MHNGRRHNCAFSTSRYPNPEEAAAAAIEFCKAVEKGEHASHLIRRERYRIPAQILPELSNLVKAAIELRQDPVAILRDGLASNDKIRPQLSKLVSQAMQLQVDPVKVLSDGIQSEIRKRIESEIRERLEGIETE
jgi:hypothetical protein